MPHAQGPMHGTASGVRPAGRLSGAAPQQLEPAWLIWVELLDRALQAAADGSWALGVPVPAGGHESGTPLIHGMLLRVNAPQLRRLTRDLLKSAASSDGTAASLAGLKARRLDALELVRASIVYDDEAIAAIADEVGADADALSVVAQLSAIPLLHACSKKLGPLVPASHDRGFCPVCGAWPALAEMRGLEKSRRLRCGRCAADWALAVLHCPFCDELRHDQMRTLLPEGEEQHRRVDVCSTCHGYMKTFTGLRPMTLRELAIRDLASVELDLIAQERGFSRPVKGAFALDVTVARTVTARRRAPAPLTVEGNGP